MSLDVMRQQKMNRMIKQLIKDLAYDNISLSQGLTRTKLIESQVKNNTLKKWLKKELEGYEYEDLYLPSYRKVGSTMTLTAELPYGRFETFPVTVPDSFDERIIDSINYHRITEPISIVEQQIDGMEDSKGYLHLPTPMVNMLAKMYKDQISQWRGAIRSGSREIGKMQYQNVLEQTKQKLLDTLIQLNEEFPNISDNYTMNDENNKKVENIITNNIYGSNNPLNIAAGETVHQNNVINISTADEDKLTALGVTKEEVDELKEIVSSPIDGKNTIGTKVMGWLGRVSSSVAGKGLYENIPEITEFVQNLIL